MMIDINYEKLEDGRIALSMDEFEDLLDALAFDEATARDEESYPVEVVEKLIAGDNPVRVFRIHRGMTQGELASMVGISQNAISDIENGKKEGSTKTLKAIAQALDVDLDDIV